MSEPTSTHGTTVRVGDIDEVLTTTRSVRRRIDLDRDVEPALIAEWMSMLYV